MVKRHLEKTPKNVLGLSERREYELSDYTGVGGAAEAWCLSWMRPDSRGDGPNPIASKGASRPRADDQWHVRRLPVAREGLV